MSLTQYESTRGWDLLTVCSAYPRFIPRSFAVSVGAARKIEPGEEITISCKATKTSVLPHETLADNGERADLTAGQTFIEREKSLQRWGFKCSCDLCTASSDEVAISDTRRLQIQTKRDQVVEAYQAGNAERAVALTEEILELMRQEDLFQLYSEQYENLGRVYWAIGDKKKAEKYARMSLAVLEEQGYVKVESGHVRMLLRSFAEAM